MRAKQVPFDVTYINLLDKPDWFLEISPHGKVPVLDVSGQHLFESNAIAEFLDEEVAPKLHPADPIKRARNRAWTDFVPTFASAMSGTYYKKTREEVDAAVEAARPVVQRLETAIEKERDGDGPYFNGDTLCMVDAAYAPFFQRFAFVEEKQQTGLLNQFPRVQAWSDALLDTALVTGAVADSFEKTFIESLKRREFHAGTLF